MLFTFPSRYWFAIGHRGVLRLGGWSPHVQTGFPVPRPTRGRGCAYPYRAITVSGAPFQTLPVRAVHTTGLVRVRSPLLAESRLMSFPPATEMFQFAGFASRGYGFTARCRRSGGLPHSEIPGSTLARSSPRLIAACYVLHRLSVPRHPPDALACLIARTRCQTHAGRSSPQRRQNLVSRSNTPALAGAFEREPFHDSMSHSSLRHPGTLGGGDRTRTDDPLPAKQVLSRLSYTPTPGGGARGCARWWAWVDSNYRPHAYQACALTD